MDILGIHRDLILAIEERLAREADHPRITRQPFACATSDGALVLGSSDDRRGIRFRVVNAELDGAYLLDEAAACKLAASWAGHVPTHPVEPIHYIDLLRKRLDRVRADLADFEQLPGASLVRFRTIGSC